MKINEVVDLEEDWKKTLGGLATAGALAFGSPNAYDNIDRSLPKHSATKKQVEPEPEKKPQIVDLQTNQAIEKRLRDAAVKANITGEQLAQLMAQCSHESAGFTKLREQNTDEFFTQQYGVKLADLLGNEQPSDGTRYKGRGLIHLTGKDNYERIGKAMGLPLAQSPEMAARPDVAIKIALWFWKNRVAPRVSDFSNTSEVTRFINSSLEGLDSREQSFINYMSTLKDEPEAPKTLALNK